MTAVALVGVGALGSHVSLFLRNQDIALKVCDMDVVEAKNCLSQMHSKPNVRKLKVQSLQQTLLFLFGTKLAVNSNRLTRDNVEALLSGSDLVIDCVDNGETRRLIQEFCLEAGIPCLHGALDANGSFGRSVWSENFRIDDETVGGAATCEDGAFLPFIGLVSAQIALSAQIFLEKGKKVGFEISPRGVFST